MKKTDSRIKRKKDNDGIDEIILHPVIEEETPFSYGDDDDIEHKLIEELKELNGMCDNEYGMKKHRHTDPEDLPIEERLRRLEHINKKLFNLFLLLKNEINKLSEESKIDEVIEILLKSSEIFKQDDNGYVTINMDESMKVIEDEEVEGKKKIGIDVDDETISLVPDENGNLKISTVPSEWVVDDNQ